MTASSSRALVVVIACFVAATVGIGGGCAALDNGTMKVLKPSAVSSKLKDLDDEDNPFAKKGATRVDFMVVEIKSYDAFFKDSAEVRGTVVLADVILKETDAYIAKVKKNGGKNALSDKQLKEFDTKRNRLGVITDLLTGVPDRSGKLLDQSGALSKNAAKTFVGPNAVKLPGVYKGLENATDDLKKAGQTAPGLLQHAQKTTASLVGL